LHDGADKNKNVMRSSNKEERSRSKGKVENPEENLSPRRNRTVDMQCAS